MAAPRGALRSSLDVDRIVRLKPRALILTLGLTVPSFAVVYLYQVLALRSLRADDFTALTLWLGQLSVGSAAGVLVQRLAIANPIPARVLALAKVFSFAFAAAALLTRDRTATLLLTVAMAWLSSLWYGLGYAAGRSTRIAFWILLSQVVRCALGVALPDGFFWANSLAGGVLLTALALDVPRDAAPVRPSGPLRVFDPFFLALLQSIIPFADLFLLKHALPANEIDRIAWAALFLRIPTLLAINASNVLVPSLESPDESARVRARRLERWVLLGHLALELAIGWSLLYWGPWLAPSSAVEGARLASLPDLFSARWATNAAGAQILVCAFNQALLFMLFSGAQRWVRDHRWLVVSAIAIGACGAWIRGSSPVLLCVFYAATLALVVFFRFAIQRRRHRA